MIDKNILVQVVLVILLVVAGVFAFVRYDRESIPCIKNPFVFGAGKMADKYKGEVSCTCTVAGEDGIKKFSFTDKEFNPKPKTTYQNNPYIGKNFTWGVRE